jgi:hypothetical protein
MAWTSQKTTIQGDIYRQKVDLMSFLDTIFRKEKGTTAPLRGRGSQ